MIHLAQRTWLHLIILVLTLFGTTIIDPEAFLHTFKKTTDPKRPATASAPALAANLPVATGIPTRTPFGAEPVVPITTPIPTVVQTPIPESVLTPVATPAPIEAPPTPTVEPEVAPQPIVPPVVGQALEAQQPEPEGAILQVDDPSPRRIIALDPGHGGPDPGVAGGAVNDIMEKDLVLRIAEAGAEMLRVDGYTVVVTRDSDTAANPDELDITGNGSLETADEVQARIDTANAVEADMLVSIHLNSYYDQSVGGTETYYCGERPFADNSWQLAALLQQSTLDSMAGFGYRVLDRGVDEDSLLSVDNSGDKPPHIAILGPETRLIPRPSEMPGVLWEPLFISNPEQDSILSSEGGIRTLAQALRSAVNGYFEVYPYERQVPSTK